MLAMCVVAGRGVGRRGMSQMLISQTRLYSTPTRLTFNTAYAVPVRNLVGVGMQTVLPRSYSSGGGLADNELRNRLLDFQDLFVEARDCIEDAVDSKGTVYYDDDAKMAQEAVETAISTFEKLLEELDESQQGEVRRANGLKLEQLKGELELALHNDDH